MPGGRRLHKRATSTGREEKAGPSPPELTQPLTWIHSNHAIGSFSSRDFRSFSTSLLSRQDSPDCTGETTDAWRNWGPMTVT